MSSESDPTAPIRVLVIGDHGIARLGLRLLLEKAGGIEVIAETADSDEGVRWARELQPDLILLDVALLGRSGIALLPSLRYGAPGARVIALSIDNDPYYAREAFDTGVDGFLVKDTLADELVAAVRAVTGGQRYLHPSLVSQRSAASRAD